MFSTMLHAVICRENEYLSCGRRGNEHAKLGEQIDLAVTGEKIEPFNPRSIMINLNLLLE